MLKTRNLISTALCAAVGVLLPIAFHSVPNAGRIFLPMHIPVLICGLACGWQFGLACGVLTPLLSSLLTGMPPTAMLPSMMIELAVYGLVSGALLECIKMDNQTIKTYISLVGAMLCGRLVAGALNAVIFQAGNYSLAIWVSASFVTALPGIAIQIVVIPLLITALKKARVISVEKSKI
jgi:Protein of unknown function (DUF1393).